MSIFSIFCMKYYDCGVQLYSSQDSSGLFFIFLAYLILSWLLIICRTTDIDISLFGSSACHLRSRLLRIYRSQRSEFDTSLFIYLVMKTRNNVSHNIVNRFLFCFGVKLLKIELKLASTGRSINNSNKNFLLFR